MKFNVTGYRIIRIPLMCVAITPASADELSAVVFHFSEGMGTIAYGSSGKGNGGTISGAMWMNQECRSALFLGLSTRRLF